MTRFRCVLGIKDEHVSNFTGFPKVDIEAQVTNALRGMRHAN